MTLGSRRCAQLVGNNRRAPVKPPAGYVLSQLRGTDVFMDRAPGRRLVYHSDRTSFRLNVIHEGENSYGLHLTLTDPNGLEIPVDASPTTSANR